MGLPLIKYDAGSGLVILDFLRGPAGFRCYYKTRAHDNVAASGIRERVLEHRDMFVAFLMPAIRVSEDLPAWSAYAKWALGGGQFEFHPNRNLDYWFRCVLEDVEYQPERAGPGVYRASFLLRVVPDEREPSDPGEVLRRFYGIPG